MSITTCRHCNATIETSFGADSPSEHAGAEGTSDDPRAPGDWDDVCDYCNYVEDKRGGPHADDAAASFFGAE
jgi:hypothetical protein